MSPKCYFPTVKEIITTLFGRLWRQPLLACFFVAVCFAASAKTIPDLNNPAAFFNLVADKLLRSTFTFGITNIPVQTNGIFVYTPAVQRLLQLSANVLDASTTNVYPSVFRPCFLRDNHGDVFIDGFHMVSEVTGTNDPQLALPIDVATLSAGCSTTNVYGVPWIIGAKKNLPNFNQFSMINAVQVTRKLQVTKPFFGAQLDQFRTNQMYIFSISNSFGVSLWNSYASNYAGNVTIVVHDVMSMTLTNDSPGFGAMNLGAHVFGKTFSITNWPGAGWLNFAPDTQVNPSSFVVPFNDGVVLLPLSAYRFSTPLFVPVSIAPAWEQNVYTPPLPNFGLLATNRLQVFILDGNHVLDYAQFRGPESSRALNKELADPDFFGVPAYLWSTNAYRGGVTPSGVVNQILVSRGVINPPYPEGQWLQLPNLPGNLPATPKAESAFFNGFFNTSPSAYGVFFYNAHFYTNTELSMVAPYIPTRTLYEETLWQANDPLVHYLASDLAVSIPGQTGLLRSDGSSSLYSADLQAVAVHFQPWGLSTVMSEFVVDPGTFDLAIKDPLVWRPDDWNFPTNFSPALSWLGRVHRGTPWQTVYLKSPNVLDEFNGPWNDYGTNTWRQWTGNQDFNDAALAAPISDWKIAAVLTALFNTNNPAQLISINSTNTSDWLAALNGIAVLTNSLANPSLASNPQFDSVVMAGNSPQAMTILLALNQTRTNQSNGIFESLGDVLFSSALTVNSPWLNVGDETQSDFGISDEAYESIPSQLLVRLRQDSVGSIFSADDGLHLRFSGSDGCFYAVQSSTNLLNWEQFGTNEPVRGSFILPLASPLDLENRFYRSVLLP